MKISEAFQIPIASLEDKVYEYHFEGNDEFFQTIEQEWIEKGTFNVHVKLDKSTTMLQVYLHIQGALSLVCDRSLEEYAYPIDLKEKLIFKYSDHSEEMGDNLFLLDRKEPRLNLSQDIYDFIALQVPMKKLHPRYQDPANQSLDDVFLYSTETEEQIKEDQAPDPRWDILKKLTEKK